MNVYHLEHFRLALILAAAHNLGESRRTTIRRALFGTP